MIDAIILAGGRGSRLAAVVPDVPKCLAPVNGRPFLDYVIAQLRLSGQINRIFIAASYLADSFVPWSRNKEVQVVVQDKLLGTAGAVKNVVENWRVSDPVLIMNGDTFIYFDVEHFINDSFIDSLIRQTSKNDKPAGAWVVHRHFFSKFKDNQSIENCLSAYKQVQYKVRHFIDIGTPEGYAEAQEAIGK